jgi:hypothetical protein
MEKKEETTMTNRHSGMQRVTPTDRGTSTDSGRLTGSARTTIASDQQRASSKRKFYSTAEGPARGDSRRGFSRNSMDGSLHTDFGKTGASRIKLLRRIERLQARAPARIDIEADIQAASAILSEPDIWKRNGMLAQEAMTALWDVYGLEALVLAPH